MQRKPTAGNTHDALEQEAERVAGDMLAARPPRARRADTARPVRTSASSGAQADMQPASVTQALAGGAQALDLPLRQDMEQRFGHDFARVRVHTGPAAERSAQDIEALAYTVGQHIVFGRGQYAPHSERGQRLLAHELTHVVQQGGGTARVQKKSDESAAAPAGPCQANAEYAEQLDAAKSTRNTLQRWLKRVANKDLRFDRLRRLRARRARRACIAAACGVAEFAALAADRATLEKLACFDESRAEGPARGACAELLNVHCPTGPPPPRDRSGAIARELQRAGVAEADQAGTKAVLEAELIEARERLKFAIGELRILQQDRSAAQAGSARLARRSRGTDAFFAAAFGPYEAAKAHDVLDLLGRAHAAVQGGAVKVTALTPEPAQVPADCDTGDAACEAACQRSGPRCSDPWFDCVIQCQIAPDIAAAEAAGEGRSAPVPGGPAPAAAVPAAGLVPATPAGPAQAAAATQLWWASEERDEGCGAAAAYYSAEPAPGMIRICVADADLGKSLGGLERLRMHASLLHELFHMVLGSADIDVYASSQLFALMRDLQADVPAAAGDGTARPADRTLALRNPDSLTRFVLQAARVSAAEASRVLPAAGPTPDAGNCQVDLAQLAIGLAHQWLRAGQRELAARAIAGKPGAAEQANLRKIESLMDLLGRAGKEQQALGKNLTTLNAPAVAPSYVKPATLKVRLRGTSVALRAVGPNVELTLPAPFFEQDRKAQIRQVLAAMGAPGQLVNYLDATAGADPDTRVLMQADAPSSCARAAAASSGSKP